MLAGNVLLMQNEGAGPRPRAGRTYFGIRAGGFAVRPVGRIEPRFGKASGTLSARAAAPVHNPIVPATARISGGGAKKMS